MGSRETKHHDLQDLGLFDDDPGGGRWCCGFDLGSDDDPAGRAPDPEGWAVDGLSCGFFAAALSSFGLLFNKIPMPIF